MRVKIYMGLVLSWAVNSNLVTLAVWRDKENKIIFSQFTKTQNIWHKS